MKYIVIGMLGLAATLRIEAEDHFSYWEYPEMVREECFVPLRIAPDDKKLIFAEAALVRVGEHVGFESRGYLRIEIQYNGQEFQLIENLQGIDVRPTMVPIGEGEIAETLLFSASRLHDLVEKAFRGKGITATSGISFVARLAVPTKSISSDGEKFVFHRYVRSEPIEFVLTDSGLEVTAYSADGFRGGTFGLRSLLRKKK